MYVSMKQFSKKKTKVVKSAIPLNAIKNKDASKKSIRAKITE